MSLEFLSTSAALLTTLIVAATAIAALVQLRHLRASNQISAMLSIGEHLNQKDYLEAQSVLIHRLADMLENPEFRDYCAAVARGDYRRSSRPEFEEVRRAAHLIGNTYEEMGILLKNGIVDSELFLDRYWGVILGTWRRMASYIAFARDVVDDRSIWENFEYLVVLSQNRQRTKPSSYPPGLRRIELANPWASETARRKG